MTLKEQASGARFLLMQEVLEAGQLTAQTLLFGKSKGDRKSRGTSTVVAEQIATACRGKGWIFATRFPLSHRRRLRRGSSS
jgi:hypothetical protein